MEHRTCPVCQTEFKPTNHNQRFCPSAKRQHKSKCAKAYENAKRRGTLNTLLARGTHVGLTFDCAHCGARCVPGENVASNATRFCARDCKAAWHKLREGLIEAWIAEPTVRDAAAYAQAMRLDPCVYCGQPSQALDHIVPKSAFGPNDWTNRAGCCHSCNSTKQQTPLLTFLAWRVYRAAFEPWRLIVAEIHTR